MVELKSVCSVKEGDGIFIPIAAINQAKETWGTDAMEFKYVHSKCFHHVYLLAHYHSFTVLNVGSTYLTQVPPFPEYSVTC